MNKFRIKFQVYFNVKLPACSNPCVGQLLACRSSVSQPSLGVKLLSSLCLFLSLQIISSSGLGQLQRHFESVPIAGVLGFIVKEMFSCRSSSRALLSCQDILCQRCWGNKCSAMKKKKISRNWWQTTAFRPPHTSPCPNSYCPCL